METSTAPRGTPLAPVGGRAMALDAATVALASAAICLWADRLAWMTALVPALLAARMALWARLAPADRGHGLGAELAFFALATALGGFNDWNSVVRHRVYDYTVPHYFPEISTIPLWMLLLWGMILRSIATLARWRGLGFAGTLRNDLRWGARTVESAGARVAALLALVLATRQCIYRYYDDPWLSWLPFAGALAVYALLFRPDRHDRRLVARFAVVGPVVEILYIQVGGLHRYALGWLGGVPLWIALWWLLAVLVWKDLGGRLQALLAARSPAPTLARSQSLP